MNFLSKLFSRKTPTKKAQESDHAEETYRKQKMTDGYTVTVTPFVPEIMKHAIVQKKITSKGRVDLGFTFSSETSNLVSIQCLEMIRKLLLEIFDDHPVIMKALEKPMPSNTIAVSFSEFNFQLGESCQDFTPVEKFKIPDDAFYTYQKLSENLQATFYNENGTQFLAGLCYHPEPYEKQVYLKNDRALIILVRGVAEPFPLQDREKMYKKINRSRYGRDCGKAGKRVFVDCSGKFGVIRHVEYNVFSNKWTYSPCDECLKDAFTYKWQNPKEEEPKPDDFSKPSDTAAQKTEVLSALPEKMQEAEKLDLTTVIKFLKMVRIQTSEFNMLSSMPNDARIPMIHKNNIESLSELKRPQFKDLTTFLISNPDWCIDFPSLKEAAGSEKETEAEDPSGEQMDLIKLKSGDSEVPVVMDSPTLSRTTSNSDPTSLASSTENLFEDFDKVEDATEHNNDFDVEMVN